MNLFSSAAEILKNSLIKILATNGYIPVIKFTDASPTQMDFANHSDVGIVIQGPVLNYKDFKIILKTVGVYKSIFPDVEICLSTWENSGDYDWDSLGIDVVFSSDPGPSETPNLERQRVSSLAGLRYLRSLGKEYCLKTRTDQRIVAPSAISYLKSLMEIGASSSRLFTSSYGTGRFRMYGFSDQLQFGTTRTLSTYWGAEDFRQQIVEDGLFTEEQEFFMKSCFYVPEIYQAVCYLQSVNHQPTWLWSDHMMAARDFFGIFDSSEVGHLQLKRETTVFDHVYPWNDKSLNLIEQHLSTGDWIQIISHKNLEDPGFENCRKALKLPSK